MPISAGPLSPVAVAMKPTEPEHCQSRTDEYGIGRQKEKSLIFCDYRLNLERSATRVGVPLW
jgi:hypothetical protein